MFAIHDDILQWIHSVAYDIGFVAVIIRLDTDTGKRGRTSYVLIGCGEVEDAVKVLLEGLGEDVNREGLRKTPLRVAKALREGTRGE